MAHVSAAIAAPPDLWRDGPDPLLAWYAAAKANGLESAILDALAFDEDEHAARSGLDMDSNQE